MELCLWTAWGKKICILEIIYKVNDMKRVFHPSMLPQWECIQIVCVCLYYTKWKFLLSQRQSSASWLVLPFYNSMKNGYSSYEYRGIKYRLLLEVLLHCWQFRTCREIKYFKELTNIPRFCQAFFPNHWTLLATSSWLYH